MKKIILLLVISCVGCTKISKLQEFSDNQSVDIQSDKIDSIKIENNRIFLLANVNNQKKRFVFDTGAPCCLYNYNGKFRDSLSIGGLTTSFGSDVENKIFVLDNFSTNSITVKNPVFHNLLKKEDLCGEKKEGIIGVDFISGGKMVLDFTDGILKYLDDKESSFLKDYKEINNVDYDEGNYNFYFEVMIQNKPVKVKFDTGYNSGILLKSKNYADLKKENEQTIIGHTMSDAVSKIESKMNVLIDNVSVANNFVKTKISSNQNVKNNVAGVGFLKNFDWVLDYDNHKIYYKPTTKSVAEDLRKYFYKVKSNGSKLAISAKDISATKYNLGQQIISVNGAQITPENICQYQKLLNETENWDTLNLVVK